MQQQQHIQQAIIKKLELDTELNPLNRIFFAFCDFAWFIFFLFNLFIPAFHQGRSWHLFSNPSTCSGLLVGCQWVMEPILSPLLNKLKHTLGGFNLQQI